MKLQVLSSKAVMLLNDDNSFIMALDPSWLPRISTKGDKLEFFERTQKSDTPVFTLTPKSISKFVDSADEETDPPTDISDFAKELLTSFFRKPPVESNGGNVTEVNYYVDPILGSDSNNGLSPITPWQTLSKISSTIFTLPSKVHLKAGATFNGQILLGSASTAQVIFSTYGGKDKAIINKPEDLNGIEIIDKGDFIIENISVDCTSGNVYDVTSGIGIYSELPVISNIIVRNFEVKNCNSFAIAIGVGGNVNNKMLNLHIHDGDISNNCNGLFTYGVNDNEYSIENVLIERVKAYDNLGLTENNWAHTGSGIIASGIKNGVIQNCEAYNNGILNNGPSGGPFGIWMYNSNGLTIQFCSSHDNKTRTNKEDGGGFDIDGGCKNCVIQYCDSYNNYGPGYALIEFGSPNLNEKNLFRENTSRNDGRAGQKGALAVHGYVTNGMFRDNKVYFDLQGAVGAGDPVVLAIYNPIMEDIVIRDNDFFLADGVTINDLGLTSDKILFRNNRVKNLTNAEFINI